MTLTFNQYIIEVDNSRREHGNWRYGQSAFNVLDEVRPDLSDKIRGTRLDPFYYDKDTQNMAEFWTWVEENW